jgi:hypothetical protein
MVGSVNVGETRGRQEPLKRVMVNKLRSNFGNGHPFATRKTVSTCLVEIRLSTRGRNREVKEKDTLRDPGPDVSLPPF